MREMFLHLLLTCILWAEVSILFDGSDKIGTGSWIDGPKLTFKNSTKSRFDMAGFRFNTPEVWWKLFSGESNYLKDSLGNLEDDGTIWQEIRFTEKAREDSRIIYPKGEMAQNKNLGFNGETIPQGLDGTPQEGYLLLKSGNKGVVPYAANQPDHVTMDMISTITSAANYYRTDYRYIDTAGTNIGTYSGSMLDNFVGETQVVLPLESDSIMVNNVKGVISPKYTSTIYMISMIAAQEYFNVDYQFLSGIFAKETNVGTESFHFGVEIGLGKFDNTEQTFGCGEVEKNTFASVGLAQPHLFPEHEAILSGARSVNEMGTMFNFTDIMFGEEYMGQGQFTLQSPYVVNSIFASAHVFLWLWDYMAYSERVCLKEVLEQHEDPYFVPALLSLLYNRGLSYDRDSVMWKEHYHDYLDIDAVEKLNTGHENYREEILVGLFAMESASKKAFNDKSIPLYDTTITLDLLRTFFYGKDGSVGSQGKGGFLKHFTVDRDSFDRDLAEAFSRLSQHWGTNTISFRHDLLTLLRIVKPHLNYHRKRPLDSESQAFIIARNIETDSCGCDGEIIDREFPFAQVEAAQKKDDKFLIQIAAVDNDSIASVRWSIDPLWKSWIDAKKVSNNYHCIVPLNTLADVDSLWIQITDMSGNAIVRTIAPKEFGEVSLLKEKESPSTDHISLRTRGNSLTVNHNLKEVKEMSITLFDLRGRHLNTPFRGTALPSTTINLEDLSQGVYILQVVVGKYSKEIKLRR